MASGANGHVDAKADAPTPSKRDIDLERKRARDRKSQQAMRDRAKWTVHNLTEQVNTLTRTLEEQSGCAAQLNQRVQHLETENEQLKVQNAALRLRLLGEGSQGRNGSGSNVPVWQIPPNNTAPSNLVDSILQGVVNTRRASRRPSLASTAPSPASPESPNASNYPLKPNLCALIDKDLRADDDISNTVGDIVKSYTEIETLPNQVAVAYIITTLLRWQTLLDEMSWNQIPDWLRPTQAQLAIPHAAWIDRVPWPKMRDYLIAHPEISLDDLAAAYSSSFFVRWQYDPSHVLITINEQSKVVITNPIYEEHIRQLKNWAVGERFQKNFPQMAKLADQETARP
jgi:hypothetical protein